jgi:hypothetical protein
MTRVVWLFSVALLVVLDATSPVIGASVTLPEQCQATRERSAQLRAELEATLSPKATTAAALYVAKPSPGVSAEKAWGDYAAGALLTGDLPMAAWAGMKAAEIQWSAETVTNAGVYLYHLGKRQDALQLLNCAYAMGYHSPYLLEALAVVHHKLGDVGTARKEITQAHSMAPDDVIIDTENSFMTTGQPPPPEPARRDPDGLDASIRELEEHVQVALNLMKIHADRIDRGDPSAQAGTYYQIYADSFPKLITIVRDQAKQARAVADPTLRQTMINSFLGAYASVYVDVSDGLLNFLTREGSSLMLWAEVLGLDSTVLGRESEHSSNYGVGYTHGGGLAHRAYEEYLRELNAASTDHARRASDCFDKPCQVQENIRFCGVWKSLYADWQGASRQRYNTAARNFDRIATRKVMQAENELLQARAFAVRQLTRMRFSKTLRPDMEGQMLQGMNTIIRSSYERHLDADGDTVSYLGEQALWAQTMRTEVEEDLASEAQKMEEETCEAAKKALLEMLAQEEWQAYRDHLKDRVAWDIQPKTESEFPCEGSIGPVTVSLDTTKLGSGQGKFDLKWKASLYKSGSDGIGVSAGSGIGVGGQNSEDSAGASGNYGPFAGKVKATLTSKVNPWNSKEYMGIKLKGSAGLGLKAGKLGAACYPSSGSVTFYPRAFYEDAMRYLSTPSSAPTGGQ